MPCSDSIISDFPFADFHCITIEEHSYVGCCVNPSLKGFQSLSIVGFAPFLVHAAEQQVVPKIWRESTINEWHYIRTISVPIAAGLQFQIK